MVSEKEMTFMNLAQPLLFRKVNFRQATRACTWQLGVMKPVDLDGAYAPLL